MTSAGIAVLDVRIGQERSAGLGEGIRARIVSEARSWLNTPYIRHARVKGAGTDCGMFPYSVCRMFGLVPDIDGKLDEIDDLSENWFCSTTEERYVRLIERFWRKLVETQARRDFKPEFLPGNVVLLRSFGSLVYNHAAIITSWPRVIHCLPATGVAEVDASTDPVWFGQEIAVFDVLSEAA